MPLKFWDDAYIAAAFLINRTPSRVINYDTPMEHLLGHKPDYNFLRTFGCAWWPNLCPYNTCKLAFHSKYCVFLGYNNHRKGYKCLDSSTGRGYISRDVIFDESVFPFSSLHPNAGERLNVNILLLPPTLHTIQGGNRVEEPNMSNADDVPAESYADIGDHGGTNDGIMVTSTEEIWSTAASPGSMVTDSPTAPNPDKKTTSESMLVLGF
jgi:hypothetical protein